MSPNILNYGIAIGACDEVGAHKSPEKCGTLDKAICEVLATK